VVLASFKIDKTVGLSQVFRLVQALLLFNERKLFPGRGFTHFFGFTGGIAINGTQGSESGRAQKKAAPPKGKRPGGC
jgi:hypothetical protein